MAAAVRRASRPNPNGARPRADTIHDVLNDVLSDTLETLEVLS